MCKLCSKLKELKELDAKQYKHIIEAWRRRDLTARNLLTDAADAIMQLSTMKISLIVNKKKAADIEGTCSGTKDLLKAMKTFLSSNWVDEKVFSYHKAWAEYNKKIPKVNLSKKTTKKAKGKKNV